MKFILTAQHMNGGNPWDESYDKPELQTMDAVEKWALYIIRWFNSTRRLGELERKLLGVKIIEAPTQHLWRKVGAMTKRDRLGLYDTYGCEHCEVTGKRFGLGGIVKIDSKFRAKKYRICDRSRA